MRDNIISVIIPVYNVASYLPRCIDSVLNQTYKQLEIILVDDGSTDTCPQICDTYQEKDSRIKVIHKQNGGLSSARNAGLDIAIGELVAFVDSDDWIEPTMYEDLLETMRTNQSDIAVCRHRNVSEGSDMSEKGNATISILDNYFVFLDHLIPPGEPILYFMVWNKLYKKQVIGNNRFKEKQIYEDIYFDHQILRNCKKIAFIDKTLYNYQINRPGATASFFNDNKLAKITELEVYLQELKESENVDIYNKYLAFSAFSSIEVYFSAIEGKASNNSKRIILNFFHKCYKALPTEQRNIRLKFFKMFPNLYIYVKMMYR